jgi:signal transduction histidine kinase
MNEAQLADVQRIQANQRHLLGLVESVLNYAKIGAGRIEYGLGDVSFSGVLAEVDEIIRPLAEAESVTYRARAFEEGADLTVYADHEKLNQILINLLANAIEFSGDRRRIEITYQPRRDIVEIRVSDNGIGIAPEYQERFFDPFVQVNGGYTQTHGGAALGLAISRELALGVGGDLAVESEIGQGSTFTLTLSHGRG